MKKIIILDKKEGETPLQALERFRMRHPAYTDVPLTYAGRLDPMASGLLLILAGEKTKEKEKYLALDKIYQFKILFGFSTDTYDVLGKVMKRKNPPHAAALKEEIKKNVFRFRGTFKQKYPPYSSKTVDGKALFEYAREGIDVQAPEREVRVKKLTFGKISKISGRILLKNIKNRIKKVKGDFRQKEILKIWEKELGNKKENFYIANFTISCSSGTYVRGIAQALGHTIGTPALAFSIRRTRLGKWSKKSKI